jgi:ABC-type nitrate/sulfonate/bicarbonate transport system substrate-binding protein
MDRFARSVRAIRRAACAAAIGLCGLGGAPAAQAADLFTPAPPEPGTEVPSAKFTFGMRPYADNTFYIIGMKKGWFKDVGITILPEPDGLKVTDTNVVALLLNGQVDMSSEFCPLILPTYKSSNKRQCRAKPWSVRPNSAIARSKRRCRSSPE